MASKNQFDLKKVTVDELMTKHVVTVDAKTNVHALMELMSENQLTAVPVVDGRGRCVGIASHADLAELLLDLDSQHQQMVEDVIGRLMGSDTGSTVVVNEIMTHDVLTVKLGSSLMKAIELMTDRAIHHLPVVDRDGQLCGFLSSLDIVKYVARRSSDSVVA